MTSDPKDNIFLRKHSLNMSGRLYELDSVKIMGILNLTPDSFYDGNQYVETKKLVDRIDSMVDQGVDIIDLGAASSKPGASTLDPKDEIKRLENALKYIQVNYPDQVLSIDTFHSEVVKFAFDYGVDIINDISGGQLDPLMFKTAADLKMPYIGMHMRGTPKSMSSLTTYNNIYQDLILYFSEMISNLVEAGVADIIIDPGFGFAKTLEQNYELFSKLDQFKILEKPMLIGVSRKSMIYNALGINSDQSLNGTTVLNTLAIQSGAKILRVHDVKEALEAVKICNFIQNSEH